MTTMTERWKRLNPDQILKKNPEKEKTTTQNKTQQRSGGRKEEIIFKYVF